jgi:molybdopterin/thiamine biosynthesis adenylyltransferase
MRACGARVNAISTKLNDSNAKKLLRGLNVVVDTFDNSSSRAAVQEACSKLHIPCLHAGMSGMYSEVIWDPGYRVPSDANDDVCDYPLARNLAVITASIASESIIRWISSDDKENYMFTLGDMKISKA